MGNRTQLAFLQEKGPEAWNSWRTDNPNEKIDLSGEILLNSFLGGRNLSGADLRHVDLRGASLYKVDFSDSDLSHADLANAMLAEANFAEAKLFSANLCSTNLERVNFVKADLRNAVLIDANLCKAQLCHADLRGGSFTRCNFREADLSHADLSEAHFLNADFSNACLSGANLWRATLAGATLSRANFLKAELREANLMEASCVETCFTDANLTGCYVYGISAWEIDLSGAQQGGLVITKPYDPRIEVDNVEVAQFVYLLLRNEKIRDVIDTIGRKGVLLLGRFSTGKEMLDRLREELRQQGYVPMMFDFDKPEAKTFTETVRLLAGLSRFVIADITKPRSVPLELQATVPEIMIPFVPILQAGEEPFSMFNDLWIAHPEWVLATKRYPSINRLIETLEEEIIRPAQECFAKLQMRKSQDMPIKDI